jgi:hypothetical protein
MPVFLADVAVIDASFPTYEDRVPSRFGTREPISAARKPRRAAVRELLGAVPELSAAVRELRGAVPELSAAVRELLGAVPELSAAVRELLGAVPRDCAAWRAVWMAPHWLASACSC